MNKPLTTDDTIDLFEVCYTIWMNKHIFFAAIIVSLLGMGWYIFAQSQQYESRLNIIFKVLPPNADESYLIKQFDLLFHRSETYSRWAAQHKKPSFTFNQINRTLNDGQAVFTRNQEELLAKVISEKETKHYVKVIASESKVLDDVYHYAQFVEMQLREKITEDLRADKVIYENLISKSSCLGDELLERYLRTLNFFRVVDSPVGFLSIGRPTLPIKTGLNSWLLLMVAAVFGSVLGTTLVILRKSIEQRIKQITDAPKS